MDIEEKIIDLYNLGESEGIEFINCKRVIAKGSLYYYFDIVLIYINILLSEKDELLVLAHELGHYYTNTATELSPPNVKKTDETRAKDWAAIHLVTYKDFIKVLNSPFVGNDFEAAEELGVDIKTIKRARNYYERQGLKVRQCDVVSWWDFEREETMFPS